MRRPTGTPLGGRNGPCGLRGPGRKSASATLNITCCKLNPVVCHICSQIVIFHAMYYIINKIVRERPKEGFPLTAATVIRPQELCLIAAATVTYGRKRIAAEICSFGRNILFRSLKFWPNHSLNLPVCCRKASFGRNKLFRPQFSFGRNTARAGALRSQPKGSYGRKLRPKDLPQFLRSRSYSNPC